MRFPQFIGATWLVLVCALAPAHAEKRVALVVGNDRYISLPAYEQLQTAVSDAHAVGRALKSIGFDIISGENLDRRGLLARLDEAAQRLTAGDTAFFFFAGHGVAVDGVNYILPADVPVVGSGQITSLTGAAVKEEDITAALMRTGARIAVIVLDACRNNPFASAGTRGIGGERGLAPHEPPGGVFAFYSASRGEAALDRLSDADRNPNSVFTRVLVPALARPDLDLPGLAVEVREEVTRLARTVDHVQRPAYYDETSGGRIFLAGMGNGSPSGGAPRPGPATAPTVPPQVAIVTSPVTPDAPAADPCSAPVTASFPTRCAAPLTAAQERGLTPKETFRECENCPEMVVVPAGVFTMGSPGHSEGPDGKSEGPQHAVTISEPFAVGKLHVTVEQFTAFVRETRYGGGSKCHVFEGDKWPERADRSWRNPGFAQEGSHPVVCLAWNDAKAYADWLANKTGRPYRLLSEAEWEYAARGRTSPGVYPRHWFGNDAKDLCRYANGADQKARDTIPGARIWNIAPCNDGYAYTSPAGHYAPNAFGLYDMAGNAEQWTADCYHDTYNGAPVDGSAWTTGTCSYRVTRGGAWMDSPATLPGVPGTLGVAARRRGFNSYETGFRVARTLIP